MTPWTCEACVAEREGYSASGVAANYCPPTSVRQFCDTCGVAVPFEERRLLVLARGREGRVAAPNPAAPAPLLHSFRSAAKLLKLDRGETLHALIKSGALRTVPGVNGQPRISEAELQRVQLEGLVPSATAGRPRRVRAPRRSSPAGSAAAEIRAIRLPGRSDSRR